MLGPTVTHGKSMHLLVLVFYVFLCIFVWGSLRWVADRIEKKWMKVFLKALAFCLVFSPSIVLIGNAHGALFFPVPALVGMVMQPDSRIHITSLSIVFFGSTMYYTFCK